MQLKIHFCVSHEISLQSLTLPSSLLPKDTKAVKVFPDPWCMSVLHTLEKNQELGKMKKSCEIISVIYFNNNKEKGKSWKSEPIRRNWN